MNVLVTAASKHGATTEIAEVMGATLADAGHDVTVRAPQDVTNIDHYEAIIVGSAVYAGHWLSPAKGFVEALAEELRGRRVWLFSSGPVGDPPKPEEDAVDVAEMLEQSGAAEHRVFAGKLDRAQLSFGEKAIVMALRAPEGDFRDWDAIRSWAGEIAESLTAAGDRRD